MSDVWLNIIMVVVFVLIGGFFAAAEIALVSLRESQVRALPNRAAAGSGCQAAVRPQPLPGRRAGRRHAGRLLWRPPSARRRWPSRSRPSWSAGGWPGPRRTVAFIAVTVLISYLSLVFGELTPKRLALQRTEGWRCSSRRSLDRIATLSRPVIWLLSLSTNVVVRLVGGDPKANREAITEEELRDLVAAHESLPATSAG